MQVNVGLIPMTLDTRRTIVLKIVLVRQVLELPHELIEETLNLVKFLFEYL